jgi:hypothetical protein
MLPPPQEIGTHGIPSLAKSSLVITWTSGTLSLALLYAEDRMGVLHPYALCWLLLVTLVFASGICGLIVGLRRACVGPRRGPALSGGLVSFVPSLLWVGLGLYGLREAGRGEAPNTLPWKLVVMATASAMEAQAPWMYPQRIETDHLVMFYDERVQHPGRDAEAMDRHVARLEAVTGTPVRAKIYWVRGRLLGRGRMACRGLALGSDRSPDDWETDSLNVDRHELAHAVLHQRLAPDADPPALFSEGWADSQAGPSPARLALGAVESRRRRQERLGPTGDTRPYLRELVGPSWYHHSDAPTYDVGGALVDYLLRRYGVGRFLRLYFTCRPGTFEADCRTILGDDFDALERGFWEEAERLAGS